MTDLPFEQQIELMRIMRQALARFAADHPELAGTRDRTRPLRPRPTSPKPQEAPHDDAA